jgi:hypothetical protein
MRTGQWITAHFIALAVFAQTDVSQVRAVLEPVYQSPELVADQIRRFAHARAPRLTQSPSAWREEAARLRKRLLEEVVYRGWPREWVDAAPRFEDLGAIPAPPGYKMRKLRYEIVPGYWSSAILYEPERLEGRAPAILNVNGHVGAPGKAVEYKQKRCINQARRGIIALNLEWPSFGELSQAENAHWYTAHIDLAGANGMGFLYLAMRRGLDYLYAHPAVDRARIGVTGLSGGGWQTIVLSALDERVAAAIPVAGYSSLMSRMERSTPNDIGDIEQNATDLYSIADYTHLTAMLAPRPALLIYNAEDDCCFRAPLVKAYIYDQVKPYYRALGAESALRWHENLDPGTHNYQLDNRVQAYRFFAEGFRMAPADAEIPSDSEIKSFEELRVGLPADNLTILGVAKRLAERARRGGALAEVLRYKATPAASVWGLANTKNKGLESEALRFEFANGLTAIGVWMKAVAIKPGAPATIVLHEDGRKAAAAAASDRVNRGEQVLAADLLLTGDASPQRPHLFTQVIAGLGERPLGIQAAQLIALARWMKSARGAPSVRVEASGMRSQVAALAAAALEPGVLSEVAVTNGLASLNELLTRPVPYDKAPELFCLELYGAFDVAR